MNSDSHSHSLTRRGFLQTAAGAAVAAREARAMQAGGGERPPNFVIVFLDDAAWADFRPFRETPYPTPNVAQLAAEGCTFHDFYVPQAICSASRAALLSGCYPGRTKVIGAHGPHDRGLDPGYATMGEVLRARGYKTGVFGKWHIGDQPETRPPARGFDESCGLMYSNDMWEFHPEDPEYWGRYPLQFWENGKVTIDRITPRHQPMLTTWYTEHAVDFIQRHRDEPFLLYVPHSMPHVPLFVSDKYRGKSGQGLYADVMMEIDWSVGQITRALRENGLDENTLVFFSSDNGPWDSYGNHSGKTPYREAKATSFDGGARSPCIMRYTGQIQAATVCSAPLCTIDLLPTFAQLAGAALPKNAVDGNDVWPIIAGKKGAKNPAAYYALSIVNQLQAILSTDGRWKLHLPHEYRHLVQAGNDGAAGRYEMLRIERALFDMQADPFERRNVIAENPAAAKLLQGYADEHRRLFYSEE